MTQYLLQNLKQARRKKYNKKIGVFPKPERIVNTL